MIYIRYLLDIIDTANEDPGLRIESFAIIKLRDGNYNLTL